MPALIRQRRRRTRRIVMTEAGFFAQKRNSPTSLALVILLHAAGARRGDHDQGAAIHHGPHDAPIVVTTYPIDPDPPREPPRPPPEQRSRSAAADRSVPRPIVTTADRCDRRSTTPPQPPIPGTGDRPRRPRHARSAARRCAAAPSSTRVSPASCSRLIRAEQIAPSARAGSRSESPSRRAAGSAPSSG